MRLSVRATLTTTLLATSLLALAAHFAGCGSDGGNGDGNDGGGSDGTVDGVAPDAGSNDGNSGADTHDGACVPKTCPASYTCGPLDDGCGHILTCGKPCTGNNICDPISHTCITKAATCTAQGAQCGIVKDACGVGIDCGNCTGGKVCDGATHTCVVAVPGDGGCSPGSLTCTGSNGIVLCGTITDGCGATKNCTCPTGQTCGGGGIAGECGTPLECQDPTNCGTFTNACGSATINCGGCVAGFVCNSTHKCVTCTPTPNPCNGRVCGNASDGCKSVSCGTCEAGVCNGGACCNPLTCGEVLDAGMEAGCTPISNNCGGQIVCEQCGGSERCVAGSCKTCQSCDAGGVCDNTAGCCYPGVCSDFPNAGCQAQSLGCGVYKVCAPCSGTQVCLGDGTCCTPQGCNGRSGVVDDGCGRTLVCPPPR